MSIVRMSPKGQVVVPAELRREIGLEPGDFVMVRRAGERRVEIERVPDDPVAAARGLLADGPSPTDALLKEKADERARERGAGLVRDPGAAR